MRGLRCGMYVIQVSVRELIRRLDSAREIPFPAVLVPLVRAADAPWPDADVRSYWRSLHDVTWKVLCIACPDTSSGSGRRADADAIGRDGTDTFIYADPRIDRLFGPATRIAPEAPTDADRSSIGWDGAVSEIARSCGLKESQLPCILIFDIVNRCMTAITIPDHADIYQMCRSLVEALGDDPGRLGEAAKKWSHALSEKYEARMQLMDRGNFVQQYKSAAASLRAVRQGNRRLYHDCAHLLEDCLHDHTKLLELAERLKAAHDDLLANNNRTGKLNRNIRRISNDLTNRQANLPIPGNPGYEGSLRMLREDENAWYEWAAIARTIDVTSAATRMSRVLFRKTVEEELDSSELVPTSWRSRWLGPKDSADQSGVRGVAAGRRRMGIAALGSGAVLTLTSLTAVFINYATSNSDSYLFWSLAALLTVAGAVIAYLAARCQR